MRKFSKRYLKAISESQPARRCAVCNSDWPFYRQGLCDRCYQQVTREWIADPRPVTLRQFVKERLDHGKAI